MENKFKLSYLKTRVTYLASQFIVSLKLSNDNYNIPLWLYLTLYLRDPHIVSVLILNLNPSIIPSQYKNNLDKISHHHAA